MCHRLYNDPGQKRAAQPESMSGCSSARTPTPRERILQIRAAYRPLIEKKIVQLSD